MGQAERRPRRRVPRQRRVQRFVVARARRGTSRRPRRAAPRRRGPSPPTPGRRGCPGRAARPPRTRRSRPRRLPPRAGPRRARSGTAGCQGSSSRAPCVGERLRVAVQHAERGGPVGAHAQLIQSVGTASSSSRAPRPAAHVEEQGRVVLRHVRDAHQACARWARASGRSPPAPRLSPSPPLREGEVVEDALAVRRECQRLPPHAGRPAPGLAARPGARGRARARPRSPRRHRPAARRGERGSGGGARRPPRARRGPARSTRGGRGARPRGRRPAPRSTSEKHDEPEEDPERDEPSAGRVLLQRPLGAPPQPERRARRAPRRPAPPARSASSSASCRARSERAVDEEAGRPGDQRRYDHWTRSSGSGIHHQGKV